MINIIINGEDKSIPADFTVSNLIEHLSLENKRLAIEVNLEIVPKSNYDQCKLSRGDKIEIVHAIGGG